MALFFLYLCTTSSDKPVCLINVYTKSLQLIDCRNLLFPNQKLILLFFFNRHIKLIVLYFSHVYIELYCCFSGIQLWYNCIVYTFSFHSYNLCLSILYKFLSQILIIFIFSYNTIVYIKLIKKTIKIFYIIIWITVSVHV